MFPLTGTWCVHKYMVRDTGIMYHFSAPIYVHVHLTPCWSSLKSRSKPCEAAKVTYRMLHGRHSFNPLYPPPLIPAWETDWLTCTGVVTMIHLLQMCMSLGLDALWPSLFFLALINLTSPKRVDSR